MGRSCFDRGVFVVSPLTFNIRRYEPRIRGVPRCGGYCYGGSSVTGRNAGPLALQQPFAGFLTTLPRLPMRCVFGVAGQNELGLLKHVSIPPPHNHDLPPSVPLGMDGDAPGVMGSPERSEERRVGKESSAV